MTDSQRSATTKPKIERFQARLPADVKAIIRHAADLTGCSLSDFVVTSAREAAEKTIREHEIIVHSVSNSKAFFEAVLNPIGPNDEAVRRRQVVGPVE